MSRDAAILAMRPEHSYGQIARAFGVTRGTVAGVIWRDKHPPAPPRPRPPPRESAVDSKIMDLMCDERERTTADVALAVGVRPDYAWLRLRHLERLGTVRLVPKVGAKFPLIWVWHEEDWA